MKARWVFLALGLGCIPDVSLEGKRCPCAEGYVCDALRDTCARSACTPALTIADFTASWATAHTIRWQWQPSGPSASFLRYELVVAESEADLASRQGSARVIGPEENEELGYHQFPVVGGVVTVTEARDLVPDTIHYAQLYVVDVNQCGAASAVVARSTTPEPLGRIVLFDDEIPAGGYLVPGAPAFALVADAGGAHLAYDAAIDAECVPSTADPEDVRATCGQPLRVQEFAIEVARDPAQPQLNRLTDQTFGSAYLELALAFESPIPAYYAVPWLALGACAEDAIYRFEALTVPLGEHALEVPLAAMTSASGPLDYPAIDTQTDGTPVCGIAISAQWHKTSTLRIDSVAIRY
jgi:hypothetical protein